MTSLARTERPGHDTADLSPERRGPASPAAAAWPPPRPASPTASSRAISRSCRKNSRPRSTASASSIQSRARSSACPMSAIPAFPRSASISTSAPTCRATASGATARWWRSRPTSWRTGATISSPSCIGCSYSFEEALLADGLPIRHIERNVRVPMYRTNIACSSAGPFAGPMVVSMRPFKPADAIRAVQITSRFPSVHGAPVHLGHPHSIGIADIDKPDYGDAVPVGGRRDSGVLGLRRHAAIGDRGAQRCRLRSRMRRD